MGVLQYDIIYQASQFFLSTANTAIAATAWMHAEKLGIEQEKENVINDGWKKKNYILYLINFPHGISGFIVRLCFTNGGIESCPYYYYYWSI